MWPSRNPKKRKEVSKPLVTVDELLNMKARLVSKIEGAIQQREDVMTANDVLIRQIEESSAVAEGQVVLIKGVL